MAATAALLTSLAPANAWAQSWLKAGPYLQELSADGVTVVFENNIKSFSWVEVREQGTSAATKYFDERDGQHQIYSQTVAPQVAAPLQNFTVRLDGLTKATTYEYRVCTREVNWLRPYSASVGDIHEGDWHTFTTFDPQATEHHLVVVSDMHHRPEVLQQTLEALNYQSAEHIIYAGDMMDNMQLTANTVKEPEEPYASFINKSVELFATKQDFIPLRGECETRGDIARHFRDYFPHQSGRLYNAYRWGDLMVVTLDGGESAADGNPLARTSNLGAFAQYRAQEARWLAQVVASEDYRTAKYRIVISHFPVTNEVLDEAEAGAAQFARLMLPVLNEAQVDLMVAGHRHPDSHTMIGKGSKGNNFPILVQGYSMGARIDIVQGNITVTTAGKNVKATTEKLSK